MNKADSNDKNGADTKQPKDRILRAKDIIPGASKNNSEKNSMAFKKISAKHTNAEQRAANIPKFDLADEIMAKHREITAIKRKAPGRQRKIESIDYTNERSKLALFEQEKIIAEIVAGDIEKLCGGIVY